MLLIYKLIQQIKNVMINFKFYQLIIMIIMIIMVIIVIINWYIIN